MIAITTSSSMSVKPARRRKNRAFMVPPVVWTGIVSGAGDSLGRFESERHRCRKQASARWEWASRTLLLLARNALVRAGGDAASTGALRTMRNIVDQIGTVEHRFPGPN